jgi:hypothetical protein
MSPKSFFVKINAYLLVRKNSSTNFWVILAIKKTSQRELTPNKIKFALSGHPGDL